MKKTLIKTIILCALSMPLIMSCASNKKSSKADYSYDDGNDYLEEESEDEYSEIPIEVRPVSDDYLGDFDPIQLQSLMVLRKSGKKLNPKEYQKFYLVPRSNSVELTFRDVANEVSVIWSKPERDKIIEACNTFLKQYEEKTVPHQKVNSKTAYFKSKCSVWFGVLNADNGCSKNDYFVNCEFIDKRPYLVFKFIPTRCDKVDAFTPKFALYMSPSQIREFLEVINQENLEALLKEKRERAYTY